MPIMTLAGSGDNGEHSVNKYNPLVFNIKLPVETSAYRKAWCVILSAFDSNAQYRPSKKLVMAPRIAPIICA